MFCVQIVAQTLDINAMRMANPKFPLTDISQPIVNRESQAQIIHAMDQPIHKDKYLVGPGDQFQINILSSDDVFTYKLVVTPTGEILIPSVGVIQVYGLTLTETIKSLESMIQSWNQNARIHITLSQIREFKIKVIGHLQNPGLYNATPGSRVSDIYKTIQEETEVVEDDRRVGKGARKAGDRRELCVVAPRRYMFLKNVGPKELPMVASSFIINSVFC